MSGSVLCHGCGQSIDVPDSHTRNKIRCPYCGVICPVAASTQKGPPAKKKPAAEADVSWDEVPDSEPELREALLPNLELGEKPRPRPKPAPEPESPPPVWPPHASDEDDGNPYAVEGGELPKCPNCMKEMERDATLCVSCGYDRRTGKKFTKTYEPMEKHWEAGLSFRARLAIFIALQSIMVLMLVGSLLADEIWAFMMSWPIFTAMTSFILGSFDSLDLARDRKGRVTLVKTWRICFIPMEPNKIDVRDYEGVITGTGRDVGFWDWLVCFALLPMGCLLAFVWFYFAIYRDRFYVGLMRDHGFPEMVLYRGWSEDRAHDIASAVRAASGLRHEGARDLKETPKKRRKTEA